MSDNRISRVTAATNVAKAHPKKSAGILATIAIVLGLIGAGRPLCVLLPAQAAAICMAITAGAEIGSGVATQLDGMTLDGDAGME